jgi:serine/threonine-protein kinase
MGYAPRDQAFTSARASAARALELDPDHPEALAVRAHVKARYENDPEGAERDFRRALEVDPGTIDALHWYSHLLMDQERFPESLERSLAALELDPLSPFINTHLGEHHLAAGQPEKALPPLRRAVELDPGYTYGQLYLGLAYVDLGRIAEALPPLRRAHELQPSNARARAFLGYALGVSGSTSEARRILDGLRDASRQPPARPADLALVEIGLGLRHDAVARLRAAQREDRVFRWELRPRPFDAVRTELPDANAPAR